MHSSLILFPVCSVFQPALQPDLCRRETTEVPKVGESSFTNASNECPIEVNKVVQIWPGKVAYNLLKTLHSAFSDWKFPTGYSGYVLLYVCLFRP